MTVQNYDICRNIEGRWSIVWVSGEKKPTSFKVAGKEGVIVSHDSETDVGRLDPRIFEETKGQEAILGFEIDPNFAKPPQKFMIKIERAN